MYGTVVVASVYNTVLARVSAGIVLTFSLGGFMCKSWGWPMLFYVFGSFSLLWLVLWFFVVSDKPDDHPWISRAERDYILERYRSHLVSSRLVSLFPQQFLL